MPKEFLIEIIDERAGVPVGTILRRYSIDCDEYVAKNLGRVVDTDPPPREYLLTHGLVDPGVLAGSQTKMTPEERKNEQQFLLNQVRALDERHETEKAAKELAAAIASKRREVSRG